MISTADVYQVLETCSDMPVLYNQGWQKNRFFRNKPKKPFFFCLNQVFMVLMVFMVFSVFVYFFEKELIYAL